MKTGNFRFGVPLITYSDKFDKAEFLWIYHWTKVLEEQWEYDPDRGDVFERELKVDGQCSIFAEQNKDILRIRFEYDFEPLEPFVTNLCIRIIDAFPANPIDLLTVEKSMTVDHNEGVEPSSAKEGLLEDNEREILDLWNTKLWTANAIGKKVHLDAGTVNNIITRLRKKLGKEKVIYHSNKKN